MTTTTFPNQQQLVYSDEKAQVYLSENPCAVGHILVFPKETAKKIENIDAATFAHLISVASFASTAIFEGLGLQGTNILVQSGNEANNPYEQLCIQVIPRKFDDGLNFQWKPQKEEDMNTIQENINNYKLSFQNLLNLL